MFGTSWRKTYLTVLRIANHHSSRFQSSFHLFRLSALFLVIRGLAIAALPRMFDLWSSGQTVFVETGSLSWILSSVVTFAAVDLWFLDTILFHVRRSLSLGFGFRPPFLSADDGFPWFVCEVINLATAALVTPNKANFWLQMLQLNAHKQSIYPLGKSVKSPFCSKCKVHPCTGTEALYRPCSP